MKSLLFKFAIAFGFLLTGMGRADAGLITYTFSTKATGALGQSTFENALVTITATSDTSLVDTFAPGIYYNISGATVSVAGVGSGVLTGSIGVVSNTFIPSVGISNFDLDRAILFAANNPAFATYDLTTSFGPAAGISNFNPGFTFPTTAGGFTLRGVSEEVIFTATTTVVPEPSTLALAAIAAVGGLIAVQRTRNRAKLVG